MDSQQVARSMRGSIGMLAMEWLMAPATTAEAERRGMAEGTGAYAVGRLGVLGDCPIDNVVGAAFFWSPTTMRAMVEDGRAVTSPAQGATIYAEICQQWGERVLDEFDGTARLGELCEQVVVAASPLGAPTFVGWRDQALPDVGPGRTFQLCQTMRELRFGRHCVAVQAAGITPLEAILSGPAGEWNAELFGWDRPYPEVAHLSETRDQIETSTDLLHAPDFEILDDAGRAELRQLAKAARAHVARTTT